VHHEPHLGKGHGGEQFGKKYYVTEGVGPQVYRLSRRGCASKARCLSKYLGGGHKYPHMAASSFVKCKGTARIAANRPVKDGFGWGEGMKILTKEKSLLEKKGVGQIGRGITSRQKAPGSMLGREKGWMMSGGPMSEANPEREVLFSILNINKIQLEDVNGYVPRGKPVLGRHK